MQAEAGYRHRTCCYSKIWRFHVQLALAVYYLVWGDLGRQTVALNEGPVS